MSRLFWSSSDRWNQNFTTSAPSWVSERSKVDDARQLGVECRVVAFAAETVLDRCQIPAAEQDRGFAPRWQCAPEAPVAGPLQLLIAEIPEREGLQAARIEPFIEAIDDLAFACSLDPSDDDDDGDMLSRRLRWTSSNWVRSSSRCALKSCLLTVRPTFAASNICLVPAELCYRILTGWNHRMRGGWLIVPGCWLRLRLRLLSALRASIRAGR